MRKLQLHYWYVDAYYGEKTTKIAHGIVSGHKELEDTLFIHTSAVNSVELDKENAELIIHTRNSVYHCPLEYCSWEKQDEYPELLPEYEWIKSNYRGKIEYPEIEEDSYLIRCEEADIDLRYFPHFENIEFYSQDTEGKPLYIENIGDIVLYAKTGAGYIRLNPGERKEVCVENAEKKE